MIDIIGASYSFSVVYGKYITVSLLGFSIEVMLKEPDNYTGWGRGG